MPVRSASRLASLRPTAVAASAAVLLLGGLTACAPASTSATPTCEPRVGAGAQSDVVDATPELGTDPDAEFPTPLNVTSTQATTLVEGDGDIAQPGAPVTLRWSIYNAATGEEVHTTGFDAPVGPALPAGLLPGMAAAVECKPVGSRIAMAIPAEEAFGELGNPQLGVPPQTPVIVVADIEQAFFAKADGAERGVFTSGLPSVVTGSNGAPGITVPSSAPPADLRVATLVEGDGDTVEDGDRVLVQYTGVTWADGEVFDSTWTDGQPAVFGTDEVVEGFGDALVGQTAGSRVVAVIPPELGYGDQQQGAIPAGSTLVFVVDVLGVLPAGQ